MTRQFLLGVLALAICGWTAPTRAAAPPSGIVKTATLPVTQWMFLGCCPLSPPFCALQGDLDARFEATPVLGGWEITALFKASGVTATGDIDASLSGKATGSTSLATGATATLRAGTFHLPGGWKLFVVCTLGVDANGVVSVQSHSIGRVKAKNCGGGCAD